MGAIKDSVVGEGGSALKKYQRAIVGTHSLAYLIRYELTNTLIGSLGGALGLLGRQKLFPGLLGACGRKPAFGKDVVLRHPRRIALGDGVVIDDGCCFDANSEAATAIRVGARCMFGRQTRLSSKLGTIDIGDDCGFGAGVTIHSAVRGSVTIGSKVIVAGHSYLGGGQYHTDRTDLPIVDQGHIEGLSLVIGDNVWIGAGAVVVTGIKVGRDAIVAAGAVVTRDVPDFAVVAGVPARVLRIRGQGEVSGAERIVS